MMGTSSRRPSSDPDFPCSLIIKTPFPTHRLASTALQALQVDAELSPLVRRRFSLITPPTSPTVSEASDNSTETQSDVAATSVIARESSSVQGEAEPDSTPVAAPPTSLLQAQSQPRGPQECIGQTVLLTEYSAKTNRMLRVAVNGFMESLGVVLGVMEKLDVDVLPAGGNAVVRA